MNLALFVVLFWTISITPGPNMLLVMSFGMSAGWRKALPLIFGAVSGLLCVALVCGVGIGAVFRANEAIFRAFMCACALYLGYLAVKMWKNAKNIEFRAQKSSAKLGALFLYGFTSCLCNPKAWASFVALLPPFFRQNRPTQRQIRLSHRAHSVDRIFKYDFIYVRRGFAPQSACHAHRATATLFCHAHRLCSGDDACERVGGVKNPSAQKR